MIEEKTAKNGRCNKHTFCFAIFANFRFFLTCFTFLRESIREVVEERWVQIFFFNPPARKVRFFLSLISQNFGGFCECNFAFAQAGRVTSCISCELFRIKPLRPNYGHTNELARIAIFHSHSCARTSVCAYSVGGLCESRVRACARGCNRENVCTLYFQSHAVCFIGEKRNQLLNRSRK